MSAKFGFPVTIRCRNKALNEIWYHYNVRGSLQDGLFVPTNPDGSKSNCASTGVSYLPKSSSTKTSTMTTATSTVTTVAPTGSGAPFEGRGYLNVESDGISKGCIISNGKWYVSGSCATFRATSNGKLIFFLIRPVA